MLILFLCVLLTLIGCADQPAIQKPEDFDPGTVSQLSFRIGEYRRSQLRKVDSPQLHGISQEISDRFTQAGYRVRNDQGSTTDSPASTMGGPSATEGRAHRLLASVGKVAMTETPQGFTLDVGNADPRAQDFQKTTTVDIHCRLVDPEDRHPAIVLSERKAVPASVAGLSDTPENFEKLRSYYVENIGATCHNLLSRLNIHPDEPERSGTGSKTWNAVQITTEYEEEPSADNGASTAAGPMKPVVAAPAEPVQSGRMPERAEQEAQTQGPDKPGRITTGTRVAPPPTRAPLVPAPIDQPPGQPNIPLGETAKPAGRDAAVLHNAPEPAVPTPVAMEPSGSAGAAEMKKAITASPVSTQQNETADWRKKKVTIFNPGNTVILKFGPDR